MNNRISLSQNNVKDLMDAFEHFFPGGAIYSADKPFTSLSGEYYWKNRKDFIDFVYRMTGVEIKNEKDITSIKKAQLEIDKLSLENPTEEKTVEAATPDKEARELQEAIRQEREAASKESKEYAEKSVREATERKQEVYKRQQDIRQTLPKDKQSKVFTELKDKVVYAVPVNTPQPIILSPDEQKLIDIAKGNPQVFSDNLAKLIIQKNPDIPIETLEPLSKIIAADATQTLINPINKPTPTGVFTALSNAPQKVTGLSFETQSELAKTTSVFTAFSEGQDNLYRTILTRSLGENITNTVLGLPQQQYTLADAQTEGAFSIKLDQLQENSFSFQEGPVFNGFSDPLNENVKSLAEGNLKDFALIKIKSMGGSGFLGKVSRFTSSRAFDNIAPFLGVETNFSYVGTNFFGKTVTKLFPQYAPLVTNITAKLGINIGIKALAPIATDAAVAASKGVAAKVGGGVISKAVTFVGTKLGLTAAGQVVGSAVPVVGNIIAFIATSIVGKAIEKVLPWIKKNAPAIVGVTVGLIVAPFAGYLTGAVAGLGAFGLASAAAGGAVTLKAVGESIAGLFAGFSRVVLAPIGTTALVIILVFPVVVALIIFIINAGAYVVPPTEGTSVSANPYIKLEKVADPAGPFENSDLPLKITYNITVTAKKGALTNISFKDTCQVITKGGTKNCPSEIPSDIPDTISPSIPYTFTYTENYSGDGYKDSLVINTLAITADTTDGGKQEFSTSASIKIGNPPEDCPSNAWPIAGKGGLNDVTQGPSAPGCTHTNLSQAIDIGVNGSTAIAVHSGIVTTGTDSCVGKFVKITSTCGSTTFSSLYGHLGAVTVKNGQAVTLGQTIGITDNTGTCTTGAHLHFEFKSSGSVPTVQKPYLTRNIPVGCCTRSSCNP